MSYNATLVTNLDWVYTVDIVSNDSLKICTVQQSMQEHHVICDRAWVLPSGVRQLSSSKT